MTDLIERLRWAAEAETTNRTEAKNYKLLIAEIERLRAALERIARRETPCLTAYGQATFAREALEDSDE